MVVLKTCYINSQKQNLALLILMSIICLRGLSLIDICAIWLLSFGVFVDEDHRKLLTLYCLPNFHKKTYKSRFITIVFPEFK